MITTVKKGHVAYAGVAWRGDVLSDALASLGEASNSPLADVSSDASAHSVAIGDQIVILGDSQSSPPTSAAPSTNWTPVSFSDETGAQYWLPTNQVVIDSDTSIPTVDQDIAYLAGKARQDDAMMPLFWLIAILGFVMANR
jgi:hypothetical protein